MLSQTIYTGPIIVTKATVMIVLLSILVALVLVYRYITRNYDYWEKRNVKFEKPVPFFGNYYRVLKLECTVPELCTELYQKYRSEKVVGFFKGSTPALVIRDPVLINKIFSDTQHFPGRGIRYDRRKDPLMHNMVTMAGDEWKETRQHMSPAFSVAKLRGMFPLLLQCTDKLQKYVSKLAEEGQEVKVYDLMSRYTQDVLGTCGFGIELNVKNFEQSKFAKLSHDFFTRSKFQIFCLYLSEIMPQLLTFYLPKAVDKVLEDTVIDLTRRIQEERGFKPCGRNDFMDILLAIQAEIGSDTKEQREKNIMSAAAQMFNMLIGGYETTATSISATLHYLAYHPDIQLDIQKEIDSVLSNQKQLSYDSLKDFTKLNMAYKEALRLIPPFPAMKRICGQQYTIPDTDITIDSGVQVYEPIEGLHYDPEYFEDPEEFRPERFASDVAKEQYNYKYIPFGEGPRKCIGQRLAEMKAIAALAVILQRCSVAPSKSSKKELSIKKTSFLVHVVEGGFPLKFIHRLK